MTDSLLGILLLLLLLLIMGPHCCKGGNAVAGTSSTKECRAIILTIISISIKEWAGGHHKGTTLLLS